MSDTDPDYIEVKTYITLEEYNQTRRALEAKLASAGIKMRVCGINVVMERLEELYGAWFEKVYWSWGEVFSHGYYGEERNFNLDAGADWIDTDIDVFWSFDMNDDDESSLALMFKLAFGGEQ